MRLASLCGVASRADSCDRAEISLLKPGGVTKTASAEEVIVAIQGVITKILSFDHSLTETYLNALATGLPDSALVRFPFICFLASPHPDIVSPTRLASSTFS